MDWLKLIVGPLAGASLGALVSLLVALIGPGRYRSWRIRKLKDILDALDTELFPRQRAVLLTEVERLATELCAIYKVPPKRSADLIRFMSYGLAIGFPAGQLLLESVGGTRWM